MGATEDSAGKLLINGKSWVDLAADALAWKECINTTGLSCYCKKFWDKRAEGEQEDTKKRKDREGKLETLRQKEKREKKEEARALATQQLEVAVSEQARAEMELKTATRQDERERGLANSVFEIGHAGSRSTNRGGAPRCTWRWWRA